MQVKVKRKEELTGELFHSDTFLGEVYEDELMHFKYVSKEKKNGKWVYYYYHKEGPTSAAMYKKTEGNPNSKYGTYEHSGGSRSYGGRTVEVKRGNSLFTKTSRQNKELTTDEKGNLTTKTRIDGGYHETK